MTEAVRTPIQAQLPIRLAVGAPYDRVTALLGPVGDEWGVRVELLPSLHDAFRAMREQPDLDATEMSMSFYMTLCADGRQPFVAIPVFISRAFRFANLYVRRSSRLQTIESLRGESIGVPEYGMTMAVWLRGMMADRFGIRVQDVRWFTTREPVLTPLPGRVAELGIDVTRIEGSDVWTCLADGTVNAAIGRPPGERRSEFRRLLPDFAGEDLAYFEQTGNFPIMHTIVVRRSLCEREPSAVPRLFAALCQAKHLAIDALNETASYVVTLPFLSASVEMARTRIGENWWPYGIGPNRGCLDTLVRYCFEQGLIARRVNVDELFWPGSVDLLDQL